MTYYTPLSIHDGYGNVHINRFRVCVKPTLERNQINWVGARMISRMPYYMDSNTASVQLGDYAWGNNNTLKFRGVAKLRPFNMLITLPIGGIAIPIPQKIRDWVMPDIHTDNVGVVATQDTGLTVQTLKREFEDEDDKKIRTAIETLVDTGVFIGGPAIRKLASKISKYLGDYAVDYNQHHFLAGRRAFRIDVGSSFGYKDDRLVVETSAIERFSNGVFASSELAMGSIPDVVREVWGQMLTKFCVVNKLVPITGEQPPLGWLAWRDAVHYIQAEVFPSVEKIQSYDQFRYINSEHRQILEAT
jgi:hypothetical protein